jgi:hypothetical protein
MSKRIFGLFIIAGLLMPVMAKADSAAWEFTTAGPQLNQGNYTFGIVFTANQNIIVDALGYYDPKNVDGVSIMAGSHPVGLYDVTTGGTLLASTTVTSSSGVFQHFAYNAITPIELLSGDTYVLEGVAGTVDDYTYNVTGFNVSAPITIQGNNFQLNTGLNYDASTSSSTDIFGPDMGGYDATPEPSSLLLLGSGLAGLAGLIKRKLTA